MRTVKRPPRGWRHKRPQTFQEFDRWLTAICEFGKKRSDMRKVYGTSFGRPQLIHNGRKPR